MSKDLFTDFGPSDRAAWEKQAVKELKGEKLEVLHWKNENGFDIPPYYSAEELNTNYSPAFSHKTWRVCVKHSGEAAAVNRKLLRDLGLAAEGIALAPQPGALTASLKGIQTELLSLQLTIGAAQGEELSQFLQADPARKEQALSLFPEKFQTSADLKALNLLQQQLGNFPGLRSFSVDALVFTEKSALPYFEIALSFAALIEQLNAGEGLKGKMATVRTSVDTDFFVQIAKLRAYRRLWKMLAKEYGANEELFLIAETDLNALTLSDGYNNLLRNTLSGMAAVIGGCNELTVLPYDSLLNTDNEMAARLALNQQYIFRHESYLDSEGDVACGAYYIEQLTDALAARALEALQEIERQGGYFVCWAAGSIQRTMEQQRKLKISALAENKRQLIGVNKYPNEKEKLKLTPAQKEFLASLAPHHPILNYELAQLERV